MNQQLQHASDVPSVSGVEDVVIQNDLSTLTPQQRLSYYTRVCESLGLNPLTRPFEYIVLNGRLTLYARKDATDQLRQLRGISLTITARERLEDIYLVTARATNADGRTDEAIGAVSIAGLRGDGLANALMKAETKAKRRVTLSICGLGWTDETEIETIPGASPVRVDVETGEISTDTPATVACADCGAAVQGYRTPNRAYSAQEVARLSREQFGRALCRPCSLRARQAESRASEADSEPGPEDDVAPYRAQIETRANHLKVSAEELTRLIMSVEPEADGIVDGLCNREQCERVLTALDAYAKTRAKAGVK